MAIVLVKDLIAGGVHFGHSVSRWNPKMEPFIFGKRNVIHIIDLKETIKGLIRSYRFISKIVGGGEQVIFVGCKQQAKPVIEAEAKRCGMPYVSERWLGGMLTNFETVRKRLDRLQELEAMKQDGTVDRLNKKVLSRLAREERKILRNLGGVRKLNRLPGAIFVVDPRRQYIAVHEARKLGIPTVALLDTDCDPDMVDIPIPGNDDSVRSIKIICEKLADAVLEGKRGKVVPRQLQPEVTVVSAGEAEPAGEELNTSPAVSPPSESDSSTDEAT